MWEERNKSENKKKQWYFFFRNGLLKLNLPLKLPNLEKKSQQVSYEVFGLVPKVNLAKICRC